MKIRHNNKKLQKIKDIIKQRKSKSKQRKSKTKRAKAKQEKSNLEKMKLDKFLAVCFSNKNFMSWSNHDMMVG